MDNFIYIGITLIISISIGFVTFIVVNNKYSEYNKKLNRVYDKIDYYETSIKILEKSIQNNIKQLNILEINSRNNDFVEQINNINESIKIINNLDIEFEKKIVDLNDKLLKNDNKNVSLIEYLQSDIREKNDNYEVFLNNIDKKIAYLETTTKVVSKIEEINERIEILEEFYIRLNEKEESYNKVKAAQQNRDFALEYFAKN